MSRPYEDGNYTIDEGAGSVSESDMNAAANVYRAMLSLSPTAGEVASTAAFKNTDDAKPVDVIEAVLHCASSWDGNARIIGNVRAKDIVRALLATSAGLCEQAITIEKLRRAAVVETPELVEKVARAMRKCDNEMIGSYYELARAAIRAMLSSAPSAPEGDQK